MYAFLILVMNCILLSAFAGKYIDRVRRVENTSSKLTLKWALPDTSTLLKNVFMCTSQYTQGAKAIRVLNCCAMVYKGCALLTWAVVTFGA